MYVYYIILHRIYPYPAKDSNPKVLIQGESQATRPYLNQVTAHSWRQEDVAIAEIQIGYDMAII